LVNDLKRNLVNRLKQAGAYDARIADPRVGFEHALTGKHPLDVWSESRSIVVFAVATSPKSNNLYIGPYAPCQEPRRVGPVPPDIQSDDWALQRLSNLFITSVTLIKNTLNRGRVTYALENARRSQKLGTIATIALRCVQRARSRTIDCCRLRRQSASTSHTGKRLTNLTQDDLMLTPQMEVLMTTITVKVPEDLLARLAPIAESFNVTIEELVRLSIEDLLSRHDASFHNGTAEILDEIRELDRRQE
jgi:hypothetical protein